MHLINVYFLINLSISRDSKDKAGLNVDLANLDSLVLQVDIKLVSAGDLRQFSQGILHVGHLPRSHHRVCPPVQLYCGSLWKYFNC